MRVYFVTGNSMKFNEAKSILSGHGVEVVQKKLDIDEVQDKDPAKVSRLKAKLAYNVLKEPLLVEDTGLCIESMNGYPGTLVKHFFSAMGPQGLVRYLDGKDRTADAVTVVSYCDSEGNVTSFEGRTSGRISETVKAGYDFAWDVIFVPNGYEKTYSELGMKEKNEISQRSKAVRKFAEWIKQ